MTDTTLAHYASVPKTTTSQHDYILLDASGSMIDKWWDTLDAIQAYVEGVRANNIHSHVLLHTFTTGNIDCIQRDVAIEDWKPLRADPIGAEFYGTPLFDAIACMCTRLRDLNPPRCSIVIVTDGQENESRYTNLTQAKALLDWCRAKGWQVTFIGANFNNQHQADLLGATASSAIGVERRMLTDAAKNLAAKRARYGLYGEQMHFSDSEKQQFGGYLNAPDRSTK